jgi:hypothetical protein
MKSTIKKTIAIATIIGGLAGFTYIGLEIYDRFNKEENNITDKYYMDNDSIKSQNTTIIGSGNQLDSTTIKNNGEEGTSNKVEIGDDNTSNGLIIENNSNK